LIFVIVLVSTIIQNVFVIFDIVFVGVDEKTLVKTPDLYTICTIILCGSSMQLSV